MSTPKHRRRFGRSSPSRLPLVTTFIKVYDGLTKEAYAAIVDEARQRHMPVAGHVPAAVGVEGALAAHQASIEHAEQYGYHFFGIGELATATSTWIAQRFLTSPGKRRPPEPT